MQEGKREGRIEVRIGHTYKPPAVLLHYLCPDEVSNRSWPCSLQATPAPREWKTNSCLHQRWLFWLFTKAGLACPPWDAQGSEDMERIEPHLVAPP